VFPLDTLEPLSDDTLSNTSPPGNELAIASFPGLSIVAAREFGIDRPSTLPPSLVQFGVGRSTCLHAMHSVVDWFAYAIWKDGVLHRLLSVSPDVHPLELGEAALLELFGFQLEGTTSHFEPEDIPLMRFKRSRSWRKKWFS